MKKRTQGESLNPSGNFLIVWEFADKKLTLGFLQKGLYTEEMTGIDFLDVYLLTAVSKRIGKRAGGLSGIAVAAHRLGGFASSRVIVTALNVLAWQRAIPIISIDFIEKRSAQEVRELLFSKRVPLSSFRPIAPSYAASPDITKTIKTPHFRIK